MPGACKSLDLNTDTEDRDTSKSSMQTIKLRLYFWLVIDLFLSPGFFDRGSHVAKATSDLTTKLRINLTFLPQVPKC